MDKITPRQSEMFTKIPVHDLSRVMTQKYPTPLIVGAKIGVDSCPKPTFLGGDDLPMLSITSIYSHHWLKISHLESSNLECVNFKKFYPFLSEHFINLCCCSFLCLMFSTNISHSKVSAQKMGTFESKNFTEGTRQTHFRWKSQHLPASHQDAGHASVSKWWWKYTKASIRPGFDGTFGHPPGRCLGILDPFPNDKKAWGTWRNLGSFAMIPILWQIRLLKFLGFRFRPSVLDCCCFGDFWAIRKTSQNKGKKRKPFAQVEHLKLNISPSCTPCHHHQVQIPLPKACPISATNRCRQTSTQLDIQLLGHLWRVTVGTPKTFSKVQGGHFRITVLKLDQLPHFQGTKNTQKILEKPRPRCYELVFVWPSQVIRIVPKFFLPNWLNYFCCFSTSLPPNERQRIASSIAPRWGRESNMKRETRKTSLAQIRRFFDTVDLDLLKMLGKSKKIFSQMVVDWWFTMVQRKNSPQTNPSWWKKSSLTAFWMVRKTDEPDHTAMAMYGSGLGQANLPPSTHEGNTVTVFILIKSPFSCWSVCSPSANIPELKPCIFRSLDLTERPPNNQNKAQQNGHHTATTYTFHPPSPLHPFLSLQTLIPLLQVSSQHFWQVTCVTSIS